MALFSLVDQYAQMHRMGHFPGTTIHDHLPLINKLRVVNDVKTYLDYGCGKGLQYSRDKIHQYWRDVTLTLFDPAVPEFSEKPEGKFDMVVCTDVAEHIPEDEINDFLDDVFGYAKKQVYISICTRPAKKVLPNGMNCHVTVKPREWWKKKIKEHHPGNIEVAVRWTE